MPSGKLRHLQREPETDRLLSVAAALKCAVLVVLLCGIAWIGATQPLDDATALTLTAAQPANAAR